MAGRLRPATENTGRIAMRTLREVPVGIARARRMHDGGTACPREMGERSDVSDHAGTHTKS